MNMPFQTFDEQGDASNCAPRLAALRAELASRGVHGFLIPRADEHQGEYVPKRAERLSWLTGFTGSAGLAIVLMEKAAVFVDGRYTLQVRNQTDTTLFETHDLMNDGPVNWIEANLPKGARLGYDPWLHTQGAIERMRVGGARRRHARRACAQSAGSGLAGSARAAARARGAASDRACRRNVAVQAQPPRGGAQEARRRCGGADACPIRSAGCSTSAARDVPHTPFALSFALLNADASVDLFIDPRKSSSELAAHLGNEVRVRAPAEFAPALDALKGKTVLADPQWGAAFIFDRLERGGAKIVRATDPCQLPKACKNEAELEGTRRAHVRDGAALSRFLAWFAREAPTGRLTEIDAVEKLEAFRREPAR